MRTPVGPPRAAPLWLGAGLLIALTLAAYAPALEAGFVWDDDDYVTANQTLRSLDGLRRIWMEPGAVPQYYPLTFTSLWLDYRLWGVAPVGYHLANVLLHALNAVLAWRVLTALAVPGAWLAAALFAVHPVHVESVAWVTERKNVLSGAFYLAALLAALRAAPLAPGSIGWDRRRSLVALAFFVAAMLSKTVTCTLPAALLLLVWWKRGRVERRDVAATAPFFAIGGGLALVTVWMEKHHVGSQGIDWQLSLVDRGLIAGRALWFYAGKLLWPWPLIFNYPRWQIDAGAWWQYLFPAAAAAVVVALWLARRRVGAGPLVGVLFFAVTLVPALGFVDVFPMRYSFVADHYQYLASLGLLTLAAAGATRAVPLPESRRTLATPAAVVLAVLGALTWRQAHAYRDAEALWMDTLAKNPSSWMAHNNLGLLLFQRGRVDEAIEHYRSAIRVRADDAFAYNNLGYALAVQGRIDDALAQFGAALRIEPDHPEAHNNMGNALMRLERVDEAIEHYRAAVRSKPRYADAYNNLAGALVAQGRQAEALVSLEEAVRLDPGYADAHYNLGIILAGAGRLDDAVRQYEETLRLRPASPGAHNNLGEVLMRLGRTDDAIRHFDQALRLEPGYVEARTNLAAARAQAAGPAAR